MWLLIRLNCGVDALQDRSHFRMEACRYCTTIPRRQQEKDPRNADEGIWISGSKFVKSLTMHDVSMGES